jgi:hypothetical protein
MLIRDAYTLRYEIWVGKPERKRPLRIPKHRWKDDFKISIKEEGVRAWTRFMKLMRAFLNTAVNLWIYKRQKIDRLNYSWFLKMDSAR